MSDIEIKAITNTPVAVHHIRQWYEQAYGIIGLQIKSELEDVLEDIKANWVPIRTGKLRDTGRVLPPTFDVVGNVTTGIEFGDDTVPYARIQHENMMYHHPHGSAKYVEIPVRRWAEGHGVRS